MKAQQIEQIAEKAGIKIVKTGPFANKEQLDKFAELIVLECIGVISEAVKEADRKFTYMGDDVPSTVHMINMLNHFGVEGQ